MWSPILPVLVLVTLIQALSLRLPLAPLISKTQSFNPSSLNLTNTLLGQWPPTPVVLDISPRLEAVIERYGSVSSNPRQVAAVTAGLQRIESAILQGPTPTQSDEPITLISNPVLFSVDLRRQPWPSIKDDIAHVVGFLSLFTTVYRAATVVDHAELRLINHQSPQPSHQTVANFMLELDL